MLVELRYNNAVHPLLEGAHARLVALDGPPAKAVSVADGVWVWRLEAGVTHAAVVIEVPDEVSPAAKATLEKATQQAQRLAARTARSAEEERDLADARAVQRRHAWRRAWSVRGGLRVTSAGAQLDATVSPPPTTRRVSALGPRVQARHDMRDGEAVFVLDVDVSFLDVTPQMPRWMPWDDLDGCVVRMYQYTGTEAGQRCEALAVVVPPALRRGDAASVDTLLFFCPKLGVAYADAFEVPPGQLQRYLMRNPWGADSWGFWQHRPDAARSPMPYGWPFARFAAQLRDANRRVMLVLPQANDADFSPFGGGAWLAKSGARVGALLDSLLKAVQADGCFKHPADAPGVRRGRVGVGGFSYGAESALRCFRECADGVSELFLFDPNALVDDARNRDAVRVWARVGDHKLRLLGGMRASGLIAFARELGASVDGSHDRRPEPLKSDASVVVLPTSVDFFARSADYRAAYARPDDPQLTAPEAPSPGVCTKAWQVHLAPGSEGLRPSYVLKRADGTFTLPQRFDGFSHEEATLCLLWNSRPDAPFDPDGFARWASDARRPPEAQINPPDSLRHQWVVFGGQGTSGRYDETFRGYLQICLETSGFAR